MRRVTNLVLVVTAGLGLLTAAGCGAKAAPHSRTPSSSERIRPTAAAPVSSASTAGGTCGGSVVIASLAAASGGGGVPALDAITFASAARGWAAGPGKILGTADGGATWRPEYSGPARLYQVDFTDASHGWAVGSSELLATSDGGRTWTPRTEPCGLIDSVHFVTPALGYAVSGAHQVRLDSGTPVATGSGARGGSGTADGGRLLVTRDGGRTWYPLPGTPARVQSACFTSPSHGYIGTPGQVWRTADGGAHWSSSFTEPATASMAPDATALQCAGPAAWALFLGAGGAMGREPYLAYTSPDGRNWHLLFGEPRTESVIRPGLRVPAGPGSYPGPFSAIAPDQAAYAGWDPAAGLGAAPLDLVTAGTRVTASGRVPGLTQPYAAAFATGTRGWVVGAARTSPSGPGRVVIVSTDNGARTWTRQAALSPRS